MEPIKPIKSCVEGADCCSASLDTGNKKITTRQLGIALLGLIAWYIIYKQLLPFSHFFSYGLLGLEKGSHLGEAIQFFVYDTPKVMMLLTLIVFVIGILRSFFTQERTRKYLAGKRETAGYDDRLWHHCRYDSHCPGTGHGP